MSAFARVGAAPFGMPLMKFALTYEGELPSTGNGSRKAEKKWEIRKHFIPQLEELWMTHPALFQIRNGVSVPDGTVPFLMHEVHHSKEQPLTSYAHVEAPVQPGHLDLCKVIQKGNRTFKPLVRNSFALTCYLDILFMRQEAPGKVYQGGDLDNRIKTLLDSLSVPPHVEQIVDDPTISDPILCLVEDDSLVTGLSVRTERLLSKQRPQSEVRLVIEVDVRVTNSRMYNSMFLGD